METSQPETAPTLTPTPDSKPHRRPGLSDGKTIQIVTLARRSGMTVMQVQQALRAGGITKSIKGKPLYGDQKVEIAAATEALKKANQKAPDLSELSRAAASVPAPLPASADDLSTEADLDAMLSRASEITEAPSADKDFPPVPNLPVELVHFWWNRDPRRTNHLCSIGWKYPSDPKLLKKWDPSGNLLRLRGPDGHVYHMDTVLMVWPRKFWDRKNATRISQQKDRLQDALDTFRANVEETQKNLQDRYGREGGKALGIIDDTDEGIEDRAGFAAARAHGLTQPKTMITVGRAAGMKGER
jgi:hypothetical protein